MNNPDKKILEKEVAPKKTFIEFEIVPCSVSVSYAAASLFICIGSSKTWVSFEICTLWSYAAEKSLGCKIEMINSSFAYLEIN
jgi:hypothetical protein